MEKPTNEKPEHLESQSNDSDPSLDINTKLANPLRQWSRTTLLERARAFADTCGRKDLEEDFAKGAIAAAYPGCMFYSYFHLTPA